MRPDPDGWLARWWYSAMGQPLATLRAGFIVALIVAMIGLGAGFAVLVVDLAMDPQDWIPWKD